MGIHVKNGTPMYGPSLCEPYSRAHLARGYRATEVAVKIAWIIETGGTKRKAGFSHSVEAADKAAEIELKLEESE